MKETVGLLEKQGELLKLLVHKSGIVCEADQFDEGEGPGSGPATAVPDPASPRSDDDSDLVSLGWTAPLSGLMN